MGLAQMLSPNRASNSQAGKSGFLISRPTCANPKPKPHWQNAHLTQKGNHWHSCLIPPNSSFLLFPLQKLPAKSRVQWSLTPRHFRSHTTLPTFQSNSSEKWKISPTNNLNSLIYVKQKKKKKKKGKKFKERNPKSGEEESVYFCFLENGWKIFFFSFF